MRRSHDLRVILRGLVYRSCLFICSLICFISLPLVGADNGVKISWNLPEERVWVGPYLWANRLQDWLATPNGLKSTVNSTRWAFRTVHLLSHRIGAQEGNVSIEAEITPLCNPTEVSNSFAGFLIGAGREMEFQSCALIHHSPGKHGGIMAGIDDHGRAIVRDFSKKSAPVFATGKVPNRFFDKYCVRLIVSQRGEWVTLWLYVFDSKKNELLSDLQIDKILAKDVEGNIALVAHPGESDTPANYLFQHWVVKGSKLEPVTSEEREIGPIVGVLYTQSRGNLYLSVQTVPLGKNEVDEVILQRARLANWYEEVARAKIDKQTWIAKFEVTPWTFKGDVDYRVLLEANDNNGFSRLFAYYGKIRKEPNDKDVVVLGAFTCSRMVNDPGIVASTFDWTPENIWFPHSEWVSRVKVHDPDLLFFSGDQVYEHASPTPMEVHFLDYLYRWYLWHWSFRPLTRVRPTICIPDDHDIYQGNLWGASGRPAKTQDEGGYVHPPEFVNAVQKTQTAHLPPPFDPTTVEQGITVYYTDINYGGLSMAVLEDRKFKSSPKELLPDSQCDNGWFQNYRFDPKRQADVPGAVLLGDRQMQFLNHWIEDWSNNVEFKVVLSQTLYASMNTLPANETRDSVNPKLEYFAPHEYPEYYEIKADADTNGWPPTARNEAIKLWRKAFAVHLCGDQHLGSTIQYGVEQWNDACFAFCVPAISTRFPRRWFPPLPGANRKENAPRYTGEYEDGFGNKITVWAVANPMQYGIEPQALYNPATGYGIVKFNKKERTITFECWPRWVSPAVPDAKPFPGWPITIHQLDNYRNAIKGYLPTLVIKGTQKPLIKVRNAETNELIYAIRLNTSEFKPFVFQDGKYTVEVINPETNTSQTIPHLTITQDQDIKTEVNLK